MARLPARPALLVALTVACLGSLGGVSQAQEDRGLFGIAPAKREIKADPPVNVEPLQVTNTTQRTYEVTIFAAPLEQQLDGGLTIQTGKDALAAAKKVLEVQNRDQTFAPDTRVEVALRWLDTFPGTKVASVGVVVRADPTDPGDNQIYRLTSILLMERPGPADNQGEFTDMKAAEGPSGSLVFTGDLTNTGTTYERPSRGHFTITRKDGPPVATIPFKGDIVLPEATRRYTGSLKKKLPAGDYTASVAVRLGSEVVRREIDFTLVGPNKLPTTSVELRNVNAFGEIGGAASVVAELANTGNRDVQVRLEAVLELPGTDEGRAAKTVTVDAPAPGESGSENLELGSLDDTRTRQVTVKAYVGDELIGEKQVRFVPNREDSSGLPILLIVAIALLIAAIAAYLLRRRRRATRDDEPAAAVAEPSREQGAPLRVTAPTAASASSSSPARVNLNTAGPEELQLLPGVGPRAAERIVEHREEFGAFSAVEELEQITGFTANRIAALRDQATV